MDAKLQRLAELWPQLSESKKQELFHVVMFAGLRTDEKDDAQYSGEKTNRQIEGDFEAVIARLIDAAIEAYTKDAEEHQNALRNVLTLNDWMNVARMDNSAVCAIADAWRAGLQFGLSAHTPLLSNQGKN